ncbi:hypothetical protein [Myroides sp. WP-1]|uniref:hypothetical protein n=1 Tax=Myroides sp. WP-1 TaxID=2759944 RepID=UPI0015F7EABD|nr:hypothetical protein [Myroides sp. WP-1]MBB1138096.1 hypothetical protein [Myroides sp. WP-1]
MQAKTVLISCPNCNAPVTLEVTQLILGTKFSCGQCSALIGLSSDSTDTVSQAINDYESTKKSVKK